MPTAALDSQEFYPRESPRTTFGILQTSVPRTERPSCSACETHGPHESLKTIRFHASENKNAQLSAPTGVPPNTTIGAREEKRAKPREKGRTHAQKRSWFHREAMRRLGPGEHTHAAVRDIIKAVRDAPPSAAAGGEGRPQTQVRGGSRSPASALTSSPLTPLHLCLQGYLSPWALRRMDSSTSSRGTWGARQPATLITSLPPPLAFLRKCL